VCEQIISRLEPIEKAPPIGGAFYIFDFIKQKQLFSLCKSPDASGNPW
jgi:hypothetical protein